MKGNATVAQNVFTSRRKASPVLPSDGASVLAPELTVLLVDARAWTREAFAHALESAGKDFRVLCVGDVAELAQMDVNGAAIVALNLTGSRGDDRCVATAITAVRSCRPGLPIVVLSDCLNAEEILAAIEHGLNGYIPISMEVKLVIDVLRFVAAGGTFVPAELLLASLDGGIPAQDTVVVRPQLNTLTPRERSVLHVLRQGKSNKHIARELDMREATVKVHVRHIMRKLGVANRTQVALVAEHLTENDRQ